MPSFPWKKAKSTTISQLVSDHLDSQRRHGRHLVVETGFPTSLVDLFVKNRERLKKPKQKAKTKPKPKPYKKQKAENDKDNSTISRSLSPSPSPSPSRQTPPSPLPVPWPSPSGSGSGSGLELRVSLPSPRFDDEIKEDVGVDEEVNEGANAKGVLVAVLRMFFVVVLALGTKKFAVGLTVSAILLFLLEYVGRNFCGFLVPCSNAKKRFRLTIQRVLRPVRIRGEKLEVNGIRKIKGLMRQEEAIKPGFSEFGKDNESTSPISDIPIAHPMCFLVPCIDHFQCKKEGEIRAMELIDEPSCDEKLQLEESEWKTVVEEKEDEERCENPESKRRKSRRAKMKSKMKHLFPGRFRSSKKEKHDLDDKINPFNTKIPVNPGEGQGDDVNQDAIRLERDSKLSSLSIGRYEGNGTFDGCSNSPVFWEEDVEEIVVGKEKEDRTEGNSGYLFLCLVILIGLVAGRFFALMLILSWCLMLKFGRKLRIYTESPAIRSFTRTSS